MSQSALAKKIGTTTASVSRWERDEVQIPLAQAAKVADALGVDLPDLLDIRPSHMPRELNAENVKHLAQLAISDVSAAIADSTSRIQNQVINLCSDDMINTRTLQIEKKHDEDLLTQRQKDSLQPIILQADELNTRAIAAINYWFDLIAQSLDPDRDDDYKTDDELRIESYMCQARAETKAFEKRQKAKQNSND